MILLKWHVWKGKNHWCIGTRKRGAVLFSNADFEAVRQELMRITYWSLKGRPWR